MTAVSVTDADEPSQPLGSPRWQRSSRADLRLWGQVRTAQGFSKWLLWVGAAIVLIFVVLAIFAPLIAPYGFDQYHGARRAIPEAGAPRRLALVRHQRALGRRALGSDLRVAHGDRGRPARRPVQLVVGVPLGLISGYYGGWLDRDPGADHGRAVRVPLPAAGDRDRVPAAEQLGSGVLAAAYRLTVIYIPQYFRVVRASVLSCASRSPTSRRRAPSGARPRTIMGRYLFFNVDAVGAGHRHSERRRCDRHVGRPRLPRLRHPADAGYRVGLRAERALDDAQGRQLVPALWPGLMIVLLITGLTLVGEGLNDVLNPSCAGVSGRPVVLPAAAAGCHRSHHRRRDHDHEHRRR